ncbi:unnamed protein product, partial [Owenia fusiformis]
ADSNPSTDDKSGLIESIANRVIELLSNQQPAQEDNVPGNSDESESDNEISFKTSDNQAEGMTTGAFSFQIPLDTHVPQQTEQKIWDNKFVDFASLLPKNSCKKESE